MFRKSVALLGGIFCWFCAVPCLSGEPQAPVSDDKVVMLSMKACCPGKTWDAAEDSIIEEFGTTNLNVEVISGSAVPEGSLKAGMTSVAIQNQATVVLRLVTEPSNVHRADLLIYRANETPKLESLHFRLGEYDDIQTLMIRIVEAVRAFLFQSQTKDEPLETVPLPTPAQSTTDAHWISIGVGLGGALMYSPGGVSPSFGIGADVYFLFASYLLLEFDYTWAFYTKDIEHNGDSATFDVKTVRGNAYWNIVPQGRIHPALGIGGGVLFVKSAGRTDLDGTTETVTGNFDETTAMGYLGGVARLAIDLSPQVAFVLKMKGGGLMPRLNIHLREQLAAEYGLPLLEVFGGIDFRFL